MGAGCGRDGCSVRYAHASCIDGRVSDIADAHETIDDNVLESSEDWFRRPRVVQAPGGGCPRQAEENLEHMTELQYAKMLLKLPTLIGGGRCPEARVTKFFEEEDSEDGDRPARIRMGEGAFPPGCAWCDVQLKEVEVEVEPALVPAPGGTLDLMVRSELPAPVTLRCNGQEIASFTPSTSYKMFSFACPPEAHVASVEVCPAAESQASLQLSPNFGLRLRGKDVQLALSVHGHADDDDVKEIEDLAAFTSAVSMQAAQLGCLQPLPRGLRFRAEQSVAFVAHGQSGEEEMDVYLNGLTVPCAAGVRLGKGARERRLFRFVVIPASCAIRSIVIRLRLKSCKDAGLVLDRTFGVRVTGSDAMGSAVFVDPKSYVMNPFRWGALSPEQTALKAGSWTWDGFYYMLAYRRTGKSHRESKDAKPLFGLTTVML